MSQTTKEERNNLFVKGLKNIAEQSLNDDELLLVRWWSKKYNLPINHPLVLSQHFETLYIEFLQDQIINEKQNKESAVEDNENWIDEITEEHDQKIKRKLAKQSKVDLTKFIEKAKRIEAQEDEFEDKY